MKYWLLFLLLVALQGNTLLKNATSNGQGTNLDQDYTITVEGVTFKMVYVQGGTFQMGGNDYNDQKPIHAVKLTDYYMMETEVTQELWEVVMGTNPSYFKDKQRPVETVSWEDAQAFITKLNEIAPPKGGGRWHLPTEAQWEYAARGGKYSKSYEYAGGNDLNEVAWNNGNSNYETKPTKGKKANELGLFDMSGNVWEWCADDYDEKAYEKAQIADITNPILINNTITIFSNNNIKNKNRINNLNRVLRSGSWINEGYCRVTNRYYNALTNRIDYIGFRISSIVTL